MVSLGIKQGGGIGDVLVLPSTADSTNEYVYRAIFDIIFFITTILLLLNIILGIIIDSFAELRE